MQFRWLYLAVIPAQAGIHQIPIGKILSILSIAVKNGLKPPELQRYLEVAGRDDPGGAQLDVQGVNIRKVPDFHGLSSVAVFGTAWRV